MFRTVLPISPSEDKISYQSSIVTIGSCFADAIGNQLLENKFRVLTNPFGIIFNPLSIFKLIHYTVEQSLPDKDTYLLHDEIHSNYEFHSDFSASSEDELRLMIEGGIQSAYNVIKKADWLFITLGTSVVYHRKTNGKLVANCHKIPASNFTKTILEEELICREFDELYQKLMLLNPGLKIILTVSPVRHVKDTLEINSVSKSILRLAAYHLSTAYAQVHYFPAFEILMDDLRDYRFYGSDMLHPNETAEKYIWEAFSSTYFDRDTVSIIEKWGKIKKSLEHRPFHPHTNSFKDFQKKTLEQLHALLPYLDVNKEIENIQKMDSEE